MTATSEVMLQNTGMILCQYTYQTKKWFD